MDSSRADSNAAASSSSPSAAAASALHGPAGSRQKTLAEVHRQSEALVHKASEELERLRRQTGKAGQNAAAGAPADDGSQPAPPLPPGVRAEKHFSFDLTANGEAGTPKTPHLRKRGSLSLSRGSGRAASGTPLQAAGAANSESAAVSGAAMADDVAPAADRSGRTLSRDDSHVRRLKALFEGRNSGSLPPRPPPSSSRKPSDAGSAISGFSDASWNADRAVPLSRVGALPSVDPRMQVINPALLSSHDSYATVVHKKTLSGESQLSMGSDISLAHSHTSGISGISGISGLSGISGMSAVSGVTEGGRSVARSTTSKASRRSNVTVASAMSMATSTKKRGGLFSRKRDKSPPPVTVGLRPSHEPTFGMRDTPVPRATSPPAAAARPPSGAKPPVAAAAGGAATAAGATGAKKRGPLLPRVASLASGSTANTAKAGGATAAPSSSTNGAGAGAGSSPSLLRKVLQPIRTGGKGAAGASAVSSPRSPSLAGSPKASPFARSGGAVAAGTAPAAAPAPRAAAAPAAPPRAKESKLSPIEQKKLEVRGKWPPPSTKPNPVSRAKLAATTKAESPRLATTMRLGPRAKSPQPRAEAQQPSTPQPDRAKPVASRPATPVSAPADLTGARGAKSEGTKKSPFSRWVTSPKEAMARIVMPTALRKPAAADSNRPAWNGNTCIRAATFDDLRSQYRWRKQINAPTVVGAGHAAHGPHSTPAHSSAGGSSMEAASSQGRSRVHSQDLGGTSQADDAVETQQTAQETMGDAWDGFVDARETIVEEDRDMQEAVMDQAAEQAANSPHAVSSPSASQLRDAAPLEAAAADAASLVVQQPPQAPEEPPQEMLETQQKSEQETTEGATGLDRRTSSWGRPPVAPVRPRSRRTSSISVGSMGQEGGDAADEEASLVASARSVTSDDASGTPTLIATRRPAGPGIAARRAGRSAPASRTSFGSGGSGMGGAGAGYGTGLGSSSRSRGVSPSPTHRASLSVGGVRSTGMSPGDLRAGARRGSVGPGGSSTAAGKKPAVRASVVNKDETVDSDGDVFVSARETLPPGRLASLAKSGDEEPPTPTWAGSPKQPSSPLAPQDAPATPATGPSRLGTAVSAAAVSPKRSAPSSPTSAHAATTPSSPATAAAPATSSSPATSTTLANTADAASILAAIPTASGAGPASRRTGSTASSNGRGRGIAARRGYGRSRDPSQESLLSLASEPLTAPMADGSLGSAAVAGSPEGSASPFLGNSAPVSRAESPTASQSASLSISVPVSGVATPVSGATTPKAEEEVEAEEAADTLSELGGHSRRSSFGAHSRRHSKQQPSLDQEQFDKAIRGTSNGRVAPGSGDFYDVVFSDAAAHSRKASMAGSPNKVPVSFEKTPPTYGSDPNGVRVSPKSSPKAGIPADAGTALTGPKKPSVAVTASAGQPVTPTGYAFTPPGAAANGKLGASGKLQSANEFMASNPGSKPPKSGGLFRRKDKSPLPTPAGSPKANAGATATVVATAGAKASKPGLAGAGDPYMATPEGKGRVSRLKKFWREAFNRS